MGLLLDGFPWWSQLTDPDPTTGRPDVQAANDCGEECVSMWIAQATKKYTDAADLRRSLAHKDGHGQTTGAELVLLLAEHGIPAVSIGSQLSELRATIKEHLTAGSPCIVLGTWLAPGVLHWVLAIGFGNDALLVMEPWSGRLTAYRWLVVNSVATGDVVQGHK